MQFRSWLGSLMCLVLTSVAWSASQSSHPHFDDHGTLQWSRRLADAQTAARAADKLILIEYGRVECGSCRAMVQNVIADGRVRAHVADLCVGLAAECDPPLEERAVADLFDEHLPGASSLPFVALVTSDLKWVAGFSGWRSVEDFGALLAKVETSPLLAATPETAARLDALAATAVKSVETGDWKAVLAATRSARSLKGRSPARVKLAAAETTARAFARDALAKAVAAGTSGGDRAALKAALEWLASVFSGETEATDADRGSKALERLGVIDALPAAERRIAREKASRDYAGTPWIAWFRPSST